MARRLTVIMVADYAALLVCILVIVSLLPGFGTPPYIPILFYLLVPGYAFVRAFSAQISTVEKLLALVAFSIALSVFLKILIGLLVRPDVPDIAISSFLSIAMLGLAIIRDRPLSSLFRASS